MEKKAMSEEHIAEAGKLVYIPIERIRPHPDNPRKDLGDLSELAESIRANGVLQNLTVVPYVSTVHNRVMKGIYTVIIGHRRRAAAEMAGLTELPCIIANMTEDEQISTMLVENMQRSDLTVYEQAKSFQQLSIDFGKSTAEISAMSGFSESTVRRRQKLAELDDKKLKKAVERGATLFDFAELEKITDPADKEKCLDAIGTANFKNVLSAAKESQKYRERRAKWLEQLSGFATQIEKQGYIGETPVDMDYYRNYGSWTRTDDVEIPTDADTVRYFYTVSDVQISIYKEHIVNSEEEAKRQKELAAREEQKSKYDQLCAISKRHYHLRRDFVLNFGAAKSNVGCIIGAAMDAMYDQASQNTYCYNSLEYEKLADLTGVEYDKESRKLDAAGFRAFKAEHPERALLIMAFWMMDGESKSYVGHDWDSGKQQWMNRFKDNQTLDQIYYILEELGYERSDEERQMSRGTHPLFDKEGES